jgi:hypothetical protein
MPSIEDVIKVFSIEDISKLDYTKDSNDEDLNTLDARYNIESRINNASNNKD